MTDKARRTVDQPKRRLWLVPAVVVALALVIQQIGNRIVDHDVSMQSIVGVLTWSVSFLVLACWWLFFSAVTRRTRLAGVAGFITLVALFLTAFRFEGQAGNFVPQFTFRFSESAEDRALAYFADSAEKPNGRITREDEAENSEGNESTSFLTTDEDWPKFGGPIGDGIVRGEQIRTDWDANPPTALWRHPVGPGWSSFAVVGDFAFTQEQRGVNECVVCYDANTGRQIWVHNDPERFEESAGGPGPRATPTIHGSRVYSLGATGILNCLDPRTGSVHWTTNVVDDNGGQLIEWAAAGSPIIYEDLVLVNTATSTAFLAAYDRLTGEKKWNGPKGQAGYATPVVASIDGVAQIVMYRASGVGGYSITNGEQLWFFEWSNTTRINVAQPIVLPDETIFISCGYGGGSALLEASLSNDTWSIASRWERPNRFKLKFNGGIYKDGFVYGLDEGILSCFAIEQGKRTWKKGRYNFGQILMVDDQLLVLTEEGELVLVDANAKSVSERTRFQALEGKTWNHPVLNRGRLFVRNAEEAACYDLLPND